MTAIWGSNKLERTQLCVIKKLGANCSLMEEPLYHFMSPFFSVLGLMGSKWSGCVRGPRNILKGIIINMLKPEVGSERKRNLSSNL